MTNEPAISFIDDTHAPDVFADAAIGFFRLNGSVRITFVAARAEHDPAEKIMPPLKQVVIGRLVMPESAAAAFAVGLFDFLQKQGVEVPGLRREDELVQ